ncbi:MAG: tetratricopeptide (TPR) repeat protein [Myxococcota bacterium]|jgi:tetratricopeptide (TPR) repeat protein
MKRIVEVERIVSGGQEPDISQLLRLAARLDKDAQTAARADVGLYELARERLLLFALRTGYHPDSADTLRIMPSPTGPHEVVLRPPRGKRAPGAALSLDRIPPDLRKTLDLTVEAAEMESVDGLDVRPVDPAVVRMLADMSPGDLAQAARAAEEEYDYERALGAWRVAVVRSRGDMALVRELTRFLTELYADFEETAELLSSEAVILDRELELALADALYQLERLDDATDAYQRLERQGAEAVVLRRLGALAHRGGDAGAALRWLERAIEQDPGDIAARELLERVRSARGDAAAAVVEQAKALADGGQIQDALALLQRSRDQGCSDGRLARLQSRLEAQQATALARQRLDAAQERADAGDWKQAAALLEEADQLDPGLATEASSLRATVHATRAGRECQAQVETALRRAAEDDLHGALRCWVRALETGIAIAEPAASDRLLAALQAAVPKGHPSDRQLHGAAELYRAEQQLESGNLAAAEATLSDARRHLKTGAALDAMSGRLRREKQGNRLAEAEALVARGAAAEAAGDTAGALKWLDKAAGLGAPVDADRERLKAQLADTKRSARIVDRLERLVAAEDWWGLKRAATETAIGEAFGARATAAIASAWKVDEGASVAARAQGVLPVSELGMPDGAALITLLDRERGLIWFGAGRRLVVLAGDTLAFVAAFTLPEAVSVERGRTRIMATAEGLLLVDAQGLTVTRLQYVDEQLRVVDHRSLEKAIPGGSDPERLARGLQWDAATGRLLALQTGLRGKYQGRLLSIDPQDARAHNDASFAQPAFNLVPVVGTDQFTVQRLLDFTRPSRSLFYFWVVDGRGHTHQRPFYDDIGAPMHSLRRVVRVGEDAPLLLAQYWYLDPLTGKVADSSMGVCLVKAEDWSLYYQVSDPSSWARDGRQFFGAFAMHRPTESVAFGSRDTEGGTAVSGFDMSRFRPTWTAPAPRGSEIISVLDDVSRGWLWAFTRGSDGTVLRAVEPDAERLAE